jgi:hypothetical protein
MFAVLVYCFSATGVPCTSCTDWSARQDLRTLGSLSVDILAGHSGIGKGCVCEHVSAYSARLTVIRPSVIHLQSVCISDDTGNIVSIDTWGAGTIHSDSDFWRKHIIL